MIQSGHCLPCQHGHPCQTLNSQVRKLCLEHAPLFPVLKKTEEPGACWSASAAQPENCRVSGKPYLGKNRAWLRKTWDGVELWRTHTCTCAHTAYMYLETDMLSTMILCGAWLGIAGLLSWSFYLLQYLLPSAWGSVQTEKSVQGVRSMWQGARIPNCLFVCWFTVLFHRKI